LHEALANADVHELKAALADPWRQDVTILGD
jgi:hypothetical protein